MKKLIWKLTAFAALLFLVACQEGKGKKHHKKEKEEQEANTGDNAQASTAPAAPCDTAIWRYVYNPARLQVIEYCKTVTGVIEETNADDDGDQHMLLKLDNGQESLLTKKNMKKKQGDLVIEAVCANKVLLKKVGATCEGYLNHIQLPKVGDHVRVSGSLVNDTHNGWNEIHPITRIEPIK
ncbi:hypothetical protein EPD60_16330 [Flaviaesturariibacter flavus]|uniref:Lipoprotein n=1 Tax=Flaviaesturariibacter flavus TaxID=2502780 RepID=A0A4R1B8B5_9BACT|nr:hypothetical protein [Flaviaesturariibacter flavus]TCJ12119.1 hypothetical protein EPD60_16330 [Flaviaesturariibacter flavus]